MSKSKTKPGEAKLSFVAPNTDAERWAKEAKASKLSLSAWIRLRLDGLEVHKAA